MILTLAINLAATLAGKQCCGNDQGRRSVLLDQLVLSLLVRVVDSQEDAKTKHEDYIGFTDTCG